jgi:hypothetical protein
MIRSNLGVYRRQPRDLGWIMTHLSSQGHIHARPVRLINSIWSKKNMLTRSVIGLSLAIATAAPLSALAQDWTPISDRILSDPTFLPLQGQFYGETSYGYAQTNNGIFQESGANLDHVRHTLNTIRQTFSYGITDRLSVNVTEAYGFSGQDRVTSPSGVTSTGVSGFDDPSFGLTYRVLDQRTGPSSLDIFGDYAPDAFSSHGASPTQDASVAAGGPTADFGLALGRETRFFTIRGSFTATYSGSSTSTNVLTAGTTNTASYWIPTLGVQTQARFTDRLSANLNANYNFEGSPLVTNNVNGVQHVVNIGDNENVNVSLNYHFIPNKLVGSVNYGHTFYSHTDLTYAADPSFDVYRSGSNNTVGVALRYVFK